MSQEYHYSVGVTIYSDQTRARAFPRNTQKENIIHGVFLGSSFARNAAGVSLEEIPEIGGSFMYGAVMFRDDHLEIYRQKDMDDFTSRRQSRIQPVQVISYQEALAGLRGFRVDTLSEEATMDFYIAGTNGYLPVEVGIRRRREVPPQVPVLKIDAAYVQVGGGYRAQHAISHFDVSEPSVIGGMNYLWVGDRIRISSLPQAIHDKIIEMGVPLKFSTEVNEWTMGSFIALKADGLHILSRETMDEFGVVSYDELRAHPLQLLSTRALIDPHTHEFDHRVMLVTVGVENMTAESKE